LLESVLEFITSIDPKTLAEMTSVDERMKELAEYCTRVSEEYAKVKAKDGTIDEVHLLDFCGDLREKTYEILRIIAVDANGMYLGHHDFTDFHPLSAMARTFSIVRFAVKKDAMGIYLVHNHPAGVAEFAPSDIELTEKIAEAARYVGVAMIDHLILAGDEHISYEAMKTREEETSDAQEQQQV